MKQFRIVSVVILFALIANPNAFAGNSSEREIASEESESVNVPKLISYDQLMALPKQDREDYLTGLREMLVELASHSDKNSPFFVDANNYKQMYSLLEALLPEANAQYNNAPKASNLKGGYIRPRFVKSTGSAEVWTCDSDEAVFNQSVGTCVDKFNGGVQATGASGCGNQEGHDYKKVYMKSTKWLGLANGPTLFYCVPRESWNRLASWRKRELSNPNGAVDQSFRFRIDGKQEIGADMTLGAQGKVGKVSLNQVVPIKDEMSVRAIGDKGYICNANGVEFQKEVGTCATNPVKKIADCDKVKGASFIPAMIRNDGVKIYCIPPRSWATLSDERRAAIDVNVGGGPAASRSDIEDAIVKAKTASDLDEAYAKAAGGRRSQESAPTSAPAKRAGRATAAVRNAVAQPQTESAALTTGSVPCEDREVSKMSCSDEAKKNSDYYNKHIDSCIFAGNASSYKNGKIKANNCEAVTKSSGLKLNCDGKGVLCNPVVFGVKQDGSPFCTAKLSEATRDCDTQSTPSTYDAQYITKAAKDNASGLKGEWEKLRTGLSKACSRDHARAFFCTECNIIMSRLDSMNVLARANDNNTCRAPLVSYDDGIKARENATKQ